MAPPANNLIMWGALIWSFRHLEHQNPSFISGDIGQGARSVQQFQRNGGTERRSTVVLDDRIYVHFIYYCAICYYTIQNYKVTKYPPFPINIYITYILSSKTTVLRSVLFLRNCCKLLALPISSEIINGF